MELFTELRVWTDEAGEIRDLTDQAAGLLNVTSRHCLGRRMHLFMLSDRGRLLEVVGAAARGHVEQFSGALRPRERRPVRVSIVLEPDDGLVRWKITREELQAESSASSEPRSHRSPVDLSTPAGG